MHHGALTPAVSDAMRPEENSQDFFLLEGLGSLCPKMKVMGHNRENCPHLQPFQRHIIQKEQIRCQTSSTNTQDLSSASGAPGISKHRWT